MPPFLFRTSMFITEAAGLYVPGLVPELAADDDAEAEPHPKERRESMTATTPPTPTVPPDEWVPVEHRFLGLDRRTIAPALLVLALAFICATVIPAIDSAIEADNPVRSGDELNLGKGLTMVPAQDWNIVTGLRVGDETNAPATGATLPVELSNGTVTLKVVVGPFAGTPNALLDQINQVNTELDDIDQFATTGDRVSVTTAQGETGVVETFTGSDVGGKIAAFVHDGTGVEIVVVGLPEDMARHQDDIEAMVESIEATTTTDGVTS